LYANADRHWCIQPADENPQCNPLQGIPHLELFHITSYDHANSSPRTHATLHTLTIPNCILVVCMGWPRNRTSSWPQTKTVTIQALSVELKSESN
jgi:hypothetical protein